MTKKDYEAFASALYRVSQAKRYQAGDGFYSFEDMLEVVAGVFEQDNPSFQRGKFILACTEGKGIRASIRERF